MDPEKKDAKQLAQQLAKPEPDNPLSTASVKAPKKIGKDPAKDDAYAQALIAVTNAEFNERQAAKPHQEHFIKKRTLIYLVISIVLSILLAIGLSVMNHKHVQSGSSSDQTQQTIQGVENFNNPKAYQ